MAAMPRLRPTRTNRQFPRETLMRTIFKIGMPALALAAGAGIAFAPPVFAQYQNAPPHGPHEDMMAKVTDPKGAMPDPSRIIVKLPNQIAWTGNKALVYGD